MVIPTLRPDVWTPAPGSPQARALAYVAAQSVGPPVDPSLRVTLQFHPDRLYGGTPILQALASAGVYRSQFETGTSNGGLTAHPGGDRWNWESRIFGLTMALHEAGIFAWDQFRSRLIDAIRHAEVDGGSEPYWQSWRRAFESLLVAKGICAGADLELRTHALAARPPGHDHR